MKFVEKEFKFFPIGFLRTKETQIPRHWSCSEVEGEIHIEKKFEKGLTGIKKGDKIVVLFIFHKSPPFSLEKLLQTPPTKTSPTGVFNTCSPHRPNPIGLSVLEVLEIKDNIIKVKRVDMFDGTPIIDIKPFKAYQQEEHQKEEQ